MSNLECIWECVVVGREVKKEDILVFKMNNDKNKQNVKTKWFVFYDEDGYLLFIFSLENNSQIILIYEVLVLSSQLGILNTKN